MLHSANSGKNQQTEENCRSFFAIFTQLLLLQNQHILAALYVHSTIDEKPFD
jgi:hypothetical protein